MNAEQQATHDLAAVRQLRMALRSRVLPVPGSLTMAPTDLEYAAARERLQYAHQQNYARSSLVGYEPLYRTRIKFARHGDQMWVYFCPAGAEFTPVSSDDADNILVSWAHPRFAHARDLDLGSSTLIGPVEWQLIERTELGNERSGALENLRVYVRNQDMAFFRRVLFEDGKAVVVSDEQPVVEEEIPSPEVPREIKSRLVLDTVVTTKTGEAVEIPFALDAAQWEAISRNPGDGTLILLGPPGTGKTTLALLRATKLVHSLYDYDDKGKLVSDIPSVTLKKARFRVFVVTEHLRNYLKDFLSSSELALPEVQIVNLRGAFLEVFVRHRTLAQWINGLRFRVSPRHNRQSDALIFIKSLPYTLRLCFFHAVLNADENAGDGCRKLVASIRDRVSPLLERNTLEEVLSKDDYQRVRRRRDEKPDMNIQDHLEVRRHRDEYFNVLRRKTELVARAAATTGGFVQTWLKKAKKRADEAIGSTQERWLLPGEDGFLLSRFVDELAFLGADQSLKTIVVRETWRELVRLVDPQQVLLRVIGDFLTTGDAAELRRVGLDRAASAAALNEWREVLNGEAKPVDEGQEEDASTLEGAALDDFDTQESPFGSPRRGAFTRTDFPLLGALARVFLASPPGATADGDRYRNVGFLLPDDLPRYDHIIVDEAQDFTYAEIQLVRSLVEPERNAVTISGDPYQRMDWRSGFTSIEGIEVPKERRFTVRRNYRQTVEISRWVRSLASALYGDVQDPMEETHSSGPVPIMAIENRLRDMVSRAVACVREWFFNDSNSFVSVLLVGFDSGMQTRIGSTLRDILGREAIHAERVTDGRFIERGRVAIADVPTVKGLEFDSVIVLVGEKACDLLDGDSPDSRVTRNHVYVGCSRARRNLQVVLQHDVARLGSRLCGRGDA